MAATEKHDEYEEPSKPVAEWTRAERVAWVKHRARQEPWPSAIASVVQDMTVMDIPLNPVVAQLGVGEAIIDGEAGVRRWIDGIQ